MLEFGGEVALEIVLDDEDVEEVGVAAGAEDVPGKSSETEGREGDGMKKSKGLAPAFGEERPEKYGASGENDGGWALCQDREAKEQTEEKEGGPACSREYRRMLVAREPQNDGGADHGDREHAAEGHVRGGRVRKADHADGSRKQEQQPASGFRSMETQREPGQHKRGEQRRERAGQPRGGFAHAEELEA
jgi:hypothetical protein